MSHELGACHMRRNLQNKWENKIQISLACRYALVLLGLISL